MDFQQLYDVCTTRFEEGFAVRTAQEVIESDSVCEFMKLLEYAVEHQKHEPKLCFRAFYVLEAMYLYPYLFTCSQKHRVLQWVPALTNRSAQRHVSKLLAMEFESFSVTALPMEKPEESELVACVESLAEWLIDEKSKVTVQIWSLEALLRLKQVCQQTQTYLELGFVLQEILPTCIELFCAAPTPGKQSRMKLWSSCGLL